MSSSAGLAAAFGCALACSSPAAPADRPQGEEGAPVGAREGGPAVKPWIPVATDPVRPEAVGLWRVPVAERDRVVSPTVRAAPGTVRFLYDGRNLTLALMSEKDWMYRSPDDHYRLASRWQGDLLQYRPPFGNWTDLARFVDGHFETAGDQRPWRFEPVPSRVACDPDDLPLLAERAAHDYSIKPTDPSPR